MPTKDSSVALLWQRRFSERLNRLVKLRLFALPVAATILLWLGVLDGDRTRLFLFAFVAFYQMAVAVYYGWEMRKRVFTIDDVMPNVVTLASGGAILVYATGDIYSPMLPGIILPAAFLGVVLGPGGRRYLSLIPVAFFALMLTAVSLDLIPRFRPLLSERPLEFQVLRTCMILLVAVQVWRLTITSLDDATGLARDIEQANEQLAAEMEASQRSHGLMLSQLAHELRNPLASIKGLHQLVQANPAAPSTATHLAVIGEEIDRLERTIGTALDYGKPPSSTSAAYFELEAPLRSALRILQSKAARKAIDVHSEWDEPFLIKGDEQAWRQVFFNLLLNAIDALPEKGKIRVTAKREDGRLAIRVHDDGPGIPLDIQPLVWEPYVTGKPGGTGLGLSIVRQVVRDHGGEVLIASAAGEGTTVSLFLPLKSENA